MTRPFSAAWVAVLRVAERQGATNLSATPGLHRFIINARWEADINPHDTETDGVPPFSVLLHYRGWPVGILARDGGSLVSLGAEATENSLLAACARWETRRGELPTPRPAAPGGTV